MAVTFRSIFLRAIAPEITKANLSKTEHARLTARRIQASWIISADSTPIGGGVVVRKAAIVMLIMPPATKMTELFIESTRAIQLAVKALKASAFLSLIQKPRMP